MSKASLEQWLQRLERLHPTEVELGLERVSTVAHQLELLPLPQTVITVAGTNGKGSTVAVLETLLGECGHSTGSYTSPHFERFNERIRCDGVEVADEQITAAFAAIEEARGDISLTYFEFATLAALLVFRARKPDVVILEVGLGGRLDAVNIADADVAIVTSIDLDHQSWLGESRDQIAREKAGVLRRNKPVVIVDPSPPAQLMASAQEIGAHPLLCLGRDFSVEEEAGQWQAVLLQNGEPRPLPVQPSGALLAENICAALQAVLLLGVEFSDAQLQRALQRVSVRGRREVVQVAGLDYVLDVAHNPASINKLLDYLSISPCKGKTIALFSAMKDKDIGAMLGAAASHFDAWFLAEQPANERAAAAAQSADMLYAAGQGMVSVSKNIRQAFRRAQSLMSEGDRLVVFGSFYTVADVLPLLEKDRGRVRQAS